MTDQSLPYDPVPHAGRSENTAASRTARRAAFAKGLPGATSGFAAQYFEARQAEAETRLPEHMDLNAPGVKKAKNNRSGQAARLKQQSRTGTRPGS